MREEIEARPLVALVIGLIIGLVSVALPAALLLLGGFIVLVRPLRSRLLVASAFAFGLVIAPLPAHPIFDALPIHGVGTISSVPKLYPEFQVFNVQVNGRTMELSTKDSSPFSLGDQIRVSGVESPLSADMEDGASFMGVEGRIQSDRLVVLGNGSGVSRLAAEWRQSFIAFFARSLDPQSAALVDAVCFNARSLLDSPTQQEFKQSGLMHIVTASGLQVFAFGFLVTTALRFFPVPRSAQILIIALVLCLYSIAAGLNPAIVRASIMTVLGLTAYLVKCEPDALSALALAGIGYLIWNPHSIYNAGFDLSFATVACIALFYRREPIDSGDFKKQFIRVANDSMRLSLVVMMAVLPLSAYYFGVVSIVSTVSNLLVCWCSPLIVVGSLTAYTVSLALPSVGSEIAVHFLSPLTHWMQTILSWTGGNGSTITIGPFSGYWLVAIYGTWALTLRRRVVQP